jgi:hypothetical protein
MESARGAVRCSYAVGKGGRKRGVGTGSAARKEAKRVLLWGYNRGLKEESRRLKEDGQARSRRQEAKAVRGSWKAKSIAKKVR